MPHITIRKVVEHGANGVARMTSSGVIKLLVGTAAILVVVALFAAGVSYFNRRIPLPKQEKLADCTSQSLSFPMTVRYHEPYQFVLGLPHTSTGQLAFRGEIQLRQSTQIVARIPISSDDITYCNWLDQKSGPGLAGFILTWSRTNQGERLGEIFVRGQMYDVLLTFSESPPRDSSLWFSSMGRVGER
jgi:hypothetical protein